MAEVLSLNAACEESIEVTHPRFFPEGLALSALLTMGMQGNRRVVWLR